MVTETSLREAKAEVRITGILAEKNLTEEKENGRGVIRGDLVIKTGNENYTTFNIYVNQYKSDGKGGFTNEENKTYAGMRTILNEYQSIAEVGLENATRIRVTKGQIRPQEYINKNTNAKSKIVKYQSSFFNRLKENEEFVYEADFDLEMFISSITSEMVKDESGDMVESGRVLVRGWIPTYNNIQPIELIAPIEDGIAEAVQDSYEVGQTVNFSGVCVNQKHVEVQEIPVKIGKPKRKEVTTYRNELIITGASEAYEEEAENGLPSAYNSEAIRLAIEEHNLKLEEESKKKETQTSNNNKPKPSGRALPF